MFVRPTVAVIVAVDLTSPVLSVSMPRDGVCLFHSLSTTLHAHIMSHLQEDWDRFNVWADDGSAHNYTLQNHYMTEVPKPSTYGSACEFKRMMIIGVTYILHYEGVRLVTIHKKYIL